LTFGSNTKNSITANNVETINITTDDTATTATGIQHTFVLYADNMSTLTVSGDAGINLDNLTGATKLTSINTSGVTAGSVNILHTLNDNITFVGGATFTDIDLSSISSSANTSSITTGAGNDNVTGGSGVDTVITAAGNDNISTGGGNDIITAGDGNDNITAGNDNDTIDAGAGNDWIFGGGGVDTMTGGADNDTYYYSAISESTIADPDTITDLGPYDKISFKAITGGTGSYSNAGSDFPVHTGIGAVLSGTTIYINTSSNDNVTDMKIRLNDATNVSSSTFTW
jgi:Ca2+-binding RTX toxin-like protein